jgi:perosamine synthetase
VQLGRLRDNNDRRRRIASYMTRRLSEIEGLDPPYESPEVMHVYHLYNALIEPGAFPIARTELMRRLWVRKRIMIGTQYSPTVNCLPAFKAIGHGEGECPVSEDVSSRIVSLPISPRFTESDVDELVEGIKDVLRS